MDVISLLVLVCSLTMIVIYFDGLYIYITFFNCRIKTFQITISVINWDKVQKYSYLLHTKAYPLFGIGNIFQFIRVPRMHHYIYNMHALLKCNHILLLYNYIAEQVVLISVLDEMMANMTVSSTWYNLAGLHIGFITIT